LRCRELQACDEQLGETKRSEVVRTTPALYQRTKESDVNGENHEPILHLVLTASVDDDFEQEGHIACAPGSWKVLDRNPDPASLLKGVEGVDFGADDDLLADFMSDLSSEFELTSEIVSFFDSSSASVIRVSVGGRSVTAKKAVHYEVRLSDGKVLQATLFSQVAHDAAKQVDKKELAKATKLFGEGKTTPDNPDIPDNPKSRITSRKSKPGQ
jgi:hypothetical protein